MVLSFLRQGMYLVFLTISVARVSPRMIFAWIEFAQCNDNLEPNGEVTISSLNFDLMIVTVTGL